MNKNEASFCAPKDFGGWHITIDEEEVLCGAYSVEGHHISGAVGNIEYDPERDCEECRKEFEKLFE